MRTLHNKDGIVIAEESDTLYTFTTPSKIKRVHDVRQLQGIGKEHPNRRVLKRVVRVMSIEANGMRSHRQSFMVTAASLDQELPGLAWAVDLLRNRGHGDGATTDVVRWWIQHASEIKAYVEIATGVGLPVEGIAEGIWQQFGEAAFDTSKTTSLEWLPGL